MTIHPFVRNAFRTRNLPNKYLTVAYDCRCLYILQGTGSLRFEQAMYPLAPGTLAIYPAGMPYEPRASEENGLEFITVNFDYTHQYAANRIGMSPLPVDRIEPERIQWTQLDIEPALFRQPMVLAGMHAAEPLLLELAGEFQARGRYYREVGSSLFQKVLFLAARTAESGSRTGKIVDETLQYIRAHLREPIDNASIARALNFHPYYLSRLMKRQTGNALHRQILLCRLEYAQRLLLNTTLSIEQIASESGFQSSGHFATKFRQRYGMSPSAYRGGYNT